MIDGMMDLPINSYEIIKDEEGNELIEVRYDVVPFLSERIVYRVPIEQIDEVKTEFKLGLYKELRGQTATDIVLFTNTLFYVSLIGMLSSIYLQVHGINTSNVYTLFSSTLATSAIAPAIFGQGITFFRPIEFIKKKRYYKKIQTYLDNEKDINSYLETIKDDSYSDITFSGDIRDIRDASYSDIMRLAKRAKQNNK